MATIYRFVIESKGKGTSNGRSVDTPQAKKGASKKGRWVSILGGEKGGVEHNRKMRAINPLLNKATNGYWEKGMRLGRAGAGLITKNTETGAIGLSPVAIAIIIAFVIQTVLKIQARDIAIAEYKNTANFKALENGGSQIRQEYDINVNMWDGRVNYNQNK